MDTDPTKEPRPMAQESTDPGGRTQVEVEHHLQHEGFGGQFGAREGARVLCMTCHREFDAHGVDADLARRVEGESDPDDMAIVVPVTCPHCATAGTLTLQFGPAAGAEESDVVAALQREPRSYDPVDHDQGDGQWRTQ